MAKLKLPEIATKIYELLVSLKDQEERWRAVKSAFALLGEVPPSGMAPKGDAAHSNENGSESQFGPHARRWIVQNQISEEMVQEVFHVADGKVDVIVSEVPGTSKREQTRSCYMLTGIQALLATDSPFFQDVDAASLCKHIGCFDTANNASARSTIRMTGTKASGFTLAAPALREAAELVKQMASK